MLMTFKKSCLLLVCLFISLGPVAAQRPTKTVFKVDYREVHSEKRIDVIFHVDRSDPVVAVALTAHVGSAREKDGTDGVCASV